MKKIIVLMFVVSLMVPAVAMAATTTTSAAVSGACSGTGCPTETISVLSNKVSLIASSSNLMYAAATGHESGDKVYGGTSGETKLYSKEASDPLALGSDSGVTSSDTAQFSSWKPL